MLQLLLMVNIHRVMLQILNAVCAGSVFEHVPGFKQEMERTIKQLLPGSSVRLVLTTDGSGIGAAIIAASTLSSQPNV
jgi:hexokinase